MSGHDIRAEVAAAIREVSAELGDGAPLTATIIKPGAPTGPEWDPQPGPPTLVSMDIIDRYKTVRELVGQAAALRETHTIMATVPSVMPAAGDQIEIMGEVFSIASVRPVKPSNVVIYLEIELDR